MGIRAAGCRIIIEAAKEEELSTTESGIILAKTAAKIQDSGKILSMGGLVNVVFEDGSKAQVGDIVKFFEHAPQKFTHGSDEVGKDKVYLTITDDDVICKIEEDKINDTAKS